MGGVEPLQGLLQMTNDEKCEAHTKLQMSDLWKTNNQTQGALMPARLSKFRLARL